jgi:hypothetical protein
MPVSVSCIKYKVFFVKKSVDFFKEFALRIRLAHLKGI